jgi:hypothetical protein
MPLYSAPRTYRLPPQDSAASRPPTAKEPDELRTNWASVTPASRNKVPSDLNCPLAQAPTAKQTTREKTTFFVTVNDLRLDPDHPSGFTIAKNDDLVNGRLESVAKPHVFWLESIFRFLPWSGIMWL